MVKITQKRANLTINLIVNPMVKFNLTNLNTLTILTILKLLKMFLITFKLLNRTFILVHLN